MTPTDALAQLLRTAHLPAQALDCADITGTDPVAPSSFRVGTAAQGSIASRTARDRRCIANSAADFRRDGRPSLARTGAPRDRSATPG